ncbi:hypothetical protein TVAG_181850 [Trichomonas vaginalis G3]|uniref:Uncharacterized protein n=1 Tax=Trichomonas vaginalis (strain ATCC PRA-98 / G3) TaxID=412133 RepID=A2F6W7_TRIV3|nr:hypothetical protein TVAGG3_0007490 [Trichomonas vaginalis G3]EAX99328.1 hypothetical protein TVAG_181850 [Trichomonas vaginalis G3]KAI5538982.1 hypothetical protein TVAGG3_0007490 [Trichomonas vaginalis G3]|eukprot:XP_001312258.1 hypothetical protein [Trichomonas vaginalis G3]
MSPFADCFISMTLSKSSSGELGTPPLSTAAGDALVKEGPDPGNSNENSAQKPKSDQLPPSFQLLLQQYILQGKFNTNTQQNIFSNPNNTTIRIRIPPRLPKKVVYTYQEEEEEETEAIQLKIPRSSRQRVSISPRFITRPTTPSKFMPPKRVLTPDWETSRSKQPFKNETKYSDDSEEEPETLADWNELDMVDHHRKLEILENRIIYGFDDAYQHPAQSIDLIYKGFNVVMTEEEHLKTERYDQEREPHIVPRFWEPRPWDKPGDLLTESQTEELETKMTIATLAPLTRSSLKSPSSVKKRLVKRSQSVMIGAPPRRGRPRRIQTDSNSLLLPIGTFETDDEDQLSEWDDFI